jgi:serine/threonine protein kinase
MQTIGRYEIVRELGEGATAAVYLAHDPFMKRQVAVKVMSYGRTDDPLFTHFFHQEAEAIAALADPAIVPVYDFGLQGEQLYMVTRYLPGGTLLDRLKAGEMALAEVNTLMTRMAGALMEAHGRDIIHRDIKPANILYDQENQAYLADFGLAKFARRASGITKELFVGTPQYMSPEQVRGEKLDGRADVYALGVVLFECLTRRLPYPAMWDEIMQKALAKEREERFQTAVALAADVNLAVTRRWHLRALG